MVNRKQKEEKIEEPPRLLANREEARGKIKTQISKGGEILNQQIRSEDDLNALKVGYKKWNDFNKELLGTLFSGQRVIEDYERHKFISYSMYGGIQETIETYTKLVTKAVEELESLEQRIDLIPENEVPKIHVPTNRLSDLIKVLQGFHKVARQLKFRREGRPTLKIDDEYDVQDLLHALLKVEFDDIRPEEWTPSYAGKSSRTDFLLKNENIVVETKKTRDVQAAKKVGDELIVDVARYRGHPNCKTLVCFIYDPDSHIQNPEGLKNDLEKSTDGQLIIKVIIEPKTY